MLGAVHGALQQQALFLRTPGSLSAGVIALLDTRAPERPRGLVALFAAAAQHSALSALTLREKEVER